MRRLVMSAVCALAVVFTAAPAGASVGQAKDSKACGLQVSHAGYGRSPDCRPDFPGFTQNHNETVIEEAA